MINGSVKIIGLSKIWGSGLTYIHNLLAHVEATGLEISSNDSNNIWGRIFTDPTSMTNVTWGGSVEARPDYLLQHPVSPHISRLRIHKYFLHRGVISVCGTSKIRFSGGGKAENFLMVPQLNNVSSKIPLLL